MCSLESDFFHKKEKIIHCALHSQPELLLLEFGFALWMNCRCLMTFQLMVGVSERLVPVVHVSIPWHEIGACCWCQHPLTWGWYLLSVSASLDLWLVPVVNVSIPCPDSTRYPFTNLTCGLGCKVMCLWEKRKNRATGLPPVVTTFQLGALCWL